MKLLENHSVRELGHPGAAFTLVELLVVISIIALLAALLAGATILYIGQQHENNTKDTIRTVHRELTSQWNQVISDAKVDINAGKVPPDVLALAGGDTARANVIYIKLKLRQQFPMNYTEMLNPVFNGIAPQEFPTPIEYSNALAKYPLAKQSNPPTPAESGACLLIALTTKSRGGKFFSADHFSSQQIGDSNGDGAPELIDGWGNPLVFYRWPTQNDDMPGINPDNKGSTQPVFQDPEDSTGTLQANVAWNTPTNPLCQQFESMCHLVRDPNNGNAPKSVYLTPVIVSMGPDGKLGIPAVVAGQPDPMRLIHGSDPAENDNIYSYRVQTR
jgi:prepilin-type N-terminal cleavage/methylation domain-containing protein